MLGKILILAAVIAYSYTPAIAGKTPAKNRQAGICHLRNDSVPPLHTLKMGNIDSLLIDRNDELLTIKMKNGLIYHYEHGVWDYEDVHFSLPDQIKKVVHHAEKTFTKMEHPPQFPGGEDSLKNYVMQFCLRHKKEVKRRFTGTFTLQFIVHLHGEVRDIEPISSDAGDSRLPDLAVQALKEGPDWIPAIQNGHVVLSYAKQIITIGL